MNGTFELIVDSFAGGGGASLGIHMALGRGPDVAINHDAGAIGMHAANHPGTRHFTEDVFKASPLKVTGGLPVGLLWASPDCRHFSRAKGGKPVEKRIRGLAWAVVKWAVEARPRVIVLENVREFQEWGPLVPRWECRGCDWKGTEGQTKLARNRRRCPRCDSLRLAETDERVPCLKRKGLTFRQFTGRLRNLGYSIEWKVLNAADYGAPTHRRRLFLIARNDGQPITWPAPSHGDPKKLTGADLFGPPLRPRPRQEPVGCVLPQRPTAVFDHVETRAGTGPVRRPRAGRTEHRVPLHGLTHRRQLYRGREREGGEMIVEYDESAWFKLLKLFERLVKAAERAADAYAFSVEAERRHNPLGGPLLPPSPRPPRGSKP